MKSQLWRGVFTMFACAVFCCAIGGAARIQQRPHAAHLLQPGPEEEEDTDKKSDDDNDKSSGDTSRKTEASGWRKVKSATGYIKQKVTMVKFQPTTPHFRVKVSTTPLEGASYTQFRAQLMSSNVIDTEGKPANWAQRALLTQKPGEFVGEFDGGLDKNGKPVWFAVFVSGYGVKYDVLVEDHAVSEKKPSKKSKKSKDE